MFIYLIYLSAFFSICSGEAYTLDGPVFVVNPDTLNLTGNSKVQYGRVGSVEQYANYVAPEVEEPEFVCSASSIEQVMRTDTWLPIKVISLPLK